MTHGPPDAPMYHAEGPPCAGHSQSALTHGSVSSPDVEYLIFPGQRVTPASPESTVEDIQRLGRLVLESRDP